MSARKKSRRKAPSARRMESPAPVARFSTTPAMPAPRRADWTVAPTLGWFALALVCFFLIRERTVRTLTGLLTHKSATTAAQTAGPAFVADAEKTAAGPAPEDVMPALPEKPDLTPTPAEHGGAPESVPGKTIEDFCADPAGATADCKHYAMDGFYAALQADEAGTATAPARVSFYGDSVSASDDLPGRLRARLQDVFGDGGPGFVHAVQPHRFNHSIVADRHASGNWQSYGVSLVTVSDDLYGVGDATAEGAGKIKLTPKSPSGKIAKVELYYLAQPKGGTADLKIDGKVEASLDTKADKKEARFEALAVDDAAHTVELDTTGGRVRLFGFTLERTTGVVVDNMALVSCTANAMLNNLAAHWQAQLAHRAPDLVVIMLGSNEAQWLAGTKAMSEYEKQWEKVLAPVRAARPGGACLVMAPLDQMGEDDEGNRVERQVGRMVDAQRRAAQSAGCAYWDTYTWQGGKGSAAKWNRKGWLGSDFIHMSKKGSAMVADGLADALINGYKAYKAR